MKPRNVVVVVVIFGISVLCVGNPVTAQDPEVRKHKVWIWQETGDCLWNIAKKYYGDPFKWRIIYEANKDYISDPRVIYPKQILEIPSLESVSKEVITLEVREEILPEEPTEDEEEILEAEEVIEESAEDEEEILEEGEIIEESAEDEEENIFE